MFMGKGDVAIVSSSQAAHPGHARARCTRCDFILYFIVALAERNNEVQKEYKLPLAVEPELGRDRAATEVVQHGIRRSGGPDADLAAFGVEKRLVSRIQRDGREQRAILVDLHGAIGICPCAQHVAIREGGRLIPYSVQAPFCPNRSVETRTALTSPSYTTLIAPLFGMLPVCTFSSTPCDGLRVSIVASVTNASWLVPKLLGFQTSGPPSCTSSLFAAIL
jgi:hypothetical protein